MVTPSISSPSDLRSKPPVPLIGPLLAPLYRAVVARRNRSFDRGDRVTRFDIPVISVGNLSVGGTGKTPMVRALTEMIRSGGHTPAIAMRGYKAKPGESSDEQAEYGAALGDIPIVAQPDRATGIAELLRNRADIDAIVLDDGFQHRYVARDLDIVLLDATRSPFADRCLPAGWLREPLDGLDRASLAVITRADLGDADQLAADLNCRFPALPVARSTHAWAGLTTGESTALDVDSLRGRHIVIALGIGHPTAFMMQCERAGAIVEDAIIKPDHHHWTSQETHRLEHLALACDGVVLTTGKDWTKLKEHARTPLRFVRPELRFSLDPEGQQILEDALRRVLG